jgi:hypothetical protein
LIVHFIGLLHSNPRNNGHPTHSTNLIQPTITTHLLRFRVRTILRMCMPLKDINHPPQQVLARSVSSRSTTHSINQHQSFCRSTILTIRGCSKTALKISRSTNLSKKILSRISILMKVLVTMLMMYLNTQEQRLKNNHNINHHTSKMVIILISINKSIHPIMFNFPHQIEKNILRIETIMTS